MSALPKHRRERVATIYSAPIGDRMVSRIEFPSSLRPMVCVECGKRLVCTVEQARKADWVVWVGGAACQDHEQVSIPARKH